MTPDDFIARWRDSGGAELANSQSFLKELCDVLGVPQPDPTQPEAEQNRYVFEKAVEFNNGDGTVSHGRIDLFKADCFVLESKQGSQRKAAEAAEALATKTKLKTARRLLGTAARGTAGWDRAMRAARTQAKNYAEAIPGHWPPFLIVVDVGHCIDLHADFSGTGKHYVPFPDPRGYRIGIESLRDKSVRDRLQAIWTDPHSLDPARQSAKVTREIAERLARLAKSLEADHDPEVVAGFLIRCLFTMFAEDVDLLRASSFTELLMSLRTEPQNFAPMAENLWDSMDRGTFSGVLREKVKHFNGKFFKDKTALPLTHDQVELLLEAAQYRWEEVEPAIFGTLLERALDPVERHKLGAHYTPRAYVERLVMPTVIEPLREAWEATYAAAVQLDNDDKRPAARKLLRSFHGRLCETRVLDPACGSGNFLYVAMELMKRLEGEVLEVLIEFGEPALPGITIDPHQFLGIEINPRAAALAELVLWIGSIQWYRRTREGVTIPEPILRDYGNIECRDAVLAWDAIEAVVDADGHPVTRWDGRTTKTHPVTGAEVPDETARTVEVRYINPRKAEWPEADYIIGNPPFLGSKRMRLCLGGNYVDSLHAATELPTESADLVMYWFDQAMEALSAEKTKRVGLVTTNGLTSTLNRKVTTARFRLQAYSFAYAIPDHPWVNEAGAADVRVAMTVLELGKQEGRLEQVVNPKQSADVDGPIPTKSSRGTISPMLRLGANLDSVTSLIANADISFMGIILVGSGFRVDKAKDPKFQKFALTQNTIVRPYLLGKALSQHGQTVHVIDFFGLDAEEARKSYPELYQHIVLNVKSERDGNSDKLFRENWWLFGRARPELRDAVSNLDRYIATTETSKHRSFSFIDSKILPDQKVRIVASEESWIHGVLSSKIHVAYSDSQGNRVGKGNDPVYNNTRCFETFPFPGPTAAQRNRIGDLAEQLDAHRKRQQSQHPKLTMTGMYNVLERLRSGDPLTAKEQTIHQQGLVSVLRQIHDDLDAAVADAYGWPADADDETILQNLVDLNAVRAAEEARGHIRYLRPEYQNPEGTHQTALPGTTTTPKSPAAAIKTKIKIQKQPWPTTLPDRMVALRTALATLSAPATPADLTKHFTRAPKPQITELLQTLTALGNLRQTDDGRFAIN